MDRVHCAACNAEHDLSELEPCFERPDACLALADEERAWRVRDAGDACTLRGDDGSARHFLRARVAIPIRGEREPFHWNAWVEIDGDSWRRLVDDTREGADDAFACAATLANDFPGYPATLGLPGIVRVTERCLRPCFVLADDVRHPLATEQRDGIRAERLLEIVGAHG